MRTKAENARLDREADRLLARLEKQFRQEAEAEKEAQAIREAREQGLPYYPEYFVSTSGYLAAAYYGQFFPWGGLIRLIKSLVRR